MALARILRQFVTSPSDVPASTLSAFEAEIAAILGNLSVPQRSTVQISFTAVPTQSGGVWLFVSILSPS